MPTPQEAKQELARRELSRRGIQVPPAVQKVASAVTMPGRGFRGLGVGAEQMILHPTQPQRALAQAAEATKPGFQAGPGQKLGAFAGGFGDPINIGANAILPGGSVIKSMLGGAALAGGSNLLDQASTGQIKPDEAKMAALGGGLTGGAVHGIAKLPNAFVRNAPAIAESTTDIPTRATEIFRANKGIEKQYTGKPEEIARKSSEVMDALTNQYDAAKAYFKQAAGKVGANLNATEKALQKPIAPMRIPGSIEAITPMVDAAAKNPTNKELVGQVFKTLLHIRQSIDHHVKYSGPGVPEISTVQQGGLKELRRGVNQMIEKIPGGEILRDADKTMAGASDIYYKLQPKMKTMGEAIDFLKATFEGKSEKSKEDMMNLLALEKLTGQPVVNDLFKALTMSRFSENLAGNKISRSIAGASPFLISALLRGMGIPFQVSLPLSAAAVTAARSPKLQGMAIRGAQAVGPTLEKAGGPMAMTIMNLMRQRFKQ